MSEGLPFLGLALAIAAIVIGFVHWLGYFDHWRGD